MLLKGVSSSKCMRTQIPFDFTLAPLRLRQEQGRLLLRKRGSFGVTIP